MLDKLVDVVALSHKRCSRPIAAQLVYATPDNFLGRTVAAYTPGVTDFALLTKEAADSLCQVQNELLTQHNLGLLIYDSYRPKTAVLDFVHFSKAPIHSDYELARKQIHYPHIEKNQFFDLGYVAEDSQHCYGNTVDLVLVDTQDKELNHGACFDYMDELSHINRTAADIGAEALKNRTILSDAMQKFGFLTYPYEFWHYSFKEKSVHTPMDFPITEELRGLNVV